MPSLVEERSLGTAKTLTRLLRSVCCHADFSSLRWKTKTEFIKEPWKWLHFEHKSSCLQRRKMKVLSRQGDFLHIWCRTLSVPRAACSAHFCSLWWGSSWHSQDCVLQKVRKQTQLVTEHLNCAVSKRTCAVRINSHGILRTRGMNINIFPYASQACIPSEGHFPL